MQSSPPRNTAAVASEATAQPAPEQDTDEALKAQQTKGKNKRRKKGKAHLTEQSESYMTDVPIGNTGNPQKASRGW